METHQVKKHSTVLPYVLGGKDDPHFQDLSGGAQNDLGSNKILKPLPHIKPLAMRLLHFGEDIGGNWTPDRIEANKAWWDREDWEVPGNGGTNDYLFEDKEEDL